MPLFEFACRACGEQFEALVRTGEHPVACPACGSGDFERLLSSFGVKTEATTRSAFAKAKEARSRLNRDKAIAEQERERHEH